MTDTHDAFDVSEREGLIVWNGGGGGGGGGVHMIISQPFVVENERVDEFGSLVISIYRFPCLALSEFLIWARMESNYGASIAFGFFWWMR